MQYFIKTPVSAIMCRSSIKMQFRKDPVRVREYGLKMVSSLLQKILLSPMIRLFSRCLHGRCTACMLVFFITGLFSCSEKITPAVPQLPATLGRLELKDTVAGVPAKKFLYRMHGKLTGSQNCIIGYYSLDKKNALYISAFTDGERAASALEKMLAKIEHSTAGFGPATVEKRKDRILYRTSGMGLTHCFYRQGNLILWWQAEPEKLEETLTYLLNKKLTLH
jgi:hypothetical protein